MKRTRSNHRLIQALCVIIFGVCATGLPFNSALAQDTSISFSGFVKSDIYSDTRNTVSARDGQFLLFPENKEFNANGTDINKNTQFNMIALQTRVQARISGPKAFGAKTSGMVEAAFFGSTEANINTLRLRHAWLKLDWTKTSLIVGQTWHPLFVTRSFPGTVSFSTGVPFQPFSRNPQIRLTHKEGIFTGILAAMSQRDFSGPGGTASLRNAVVPNLHAQVQVGTDDISGGVGVDFKRLDIDAQKYNPVNSYSYFGFFHLPVSIFTSKSYILYGENMQDQLMLGGVAREATGGNNNYNLLPYKTISLWHDLTTGFRGDPNKITYEIGLFTGYSKNLGTDQNNIVTIPGFVRGADVDYLYRIAPRVQAQSGSIRFSVEADITAAAYGSIESDGTVTNSDPVTNLRLLIGAWLFF
ncbi:hypothetical protein [Fodinibius halophilus]|uniref:Porin n=1 Tax=Fodinibius halophilus TaxID=1736908 RepID=A0A6M1TGS4_9BACT|nr:hypothetical protein [Fodinibius halophilus]NGP87850.1 hypothetical protein [Fodinibius halophilus]